MQRQQYVEEDEIDEEEIDIDAIDDEQTLIQLLDDTEDFDDRKRIRDRLRKVQFEIKAQREEQRQRRENEREAAIRNRLKEAEEKKQRTLQMYNDMAKAGPHGVKKPLDGSRSESPVPGLADKPRDLVEETIRQRVKAADDRKKRLLAAYDHAAKNQPAGQARIVEFDNFKRADVSKLETPKVPKGSCCFGMSGGIPKVEKVAPVATPKSPPADESNLDPMERAIRARVREAEERKRRTLAAYDMVARSGGAGPKVVILEEFKNLDFGDKPKPRYDPCFRGGLKTQS